MTSPDIKKIIHVNDSATCINPRAADIKGQEQAAPEGAGLRAIAHGVAALGIPDEERLSKEFPIYDALLEYARRME